MSSNEMKWECIVYSIASVNKLPKPHQILSSMCESSYIKRSNSSSLRLFPPNTNIHTHALTQCSHKSPFTASIITFTANNFSAKRLRGVEAIIISRKRKKKFAMKKRRKENCCLMKPFVSIFLIQKNRGLIYGLCHKLWSFWSLRLTVCNIRFVLCFRARFFSPLLLMFICMYMVLQIQPYHNVKPTPKIPFSSCPVLK